MLVTIGIDVGHTTGMVALAYFESSKKPVVWRSESYPINCIHKFTADLHEWVKLYSADEVIIEYPEVTHNNTYRPDVLKNLISIIQDIVRPVPNIREVKPTQWKQTPVLDREFRYGEPLNTKHEADAAKMALWSMIYGKKKN